MRMRHNVPIAWRVTGGLLAASVLPVLLLSYLGFTRMSGAVNQASYRNLQLTAAITASRLDQLIKDTRVSITAACRSERVRELCAGDTDAHPEVERLMRVMMSADKELLGIYVTDSGGMVIASDDVGNLGRDISFREYWKRARQGETYVSTILVGKRSRRAGIYFAGPVRSDAGEILGVAFLKYDAGIVRRIIGEVRIGGRGHAMLADDNTVILAHSIDRQLIYHSIIPLTPEQIETIDPQRRWGRATIPAAPVTYSEVVGDPTKEATYRATLDGQDYFAGQSRLKQMPWLVIAYESVAEFEAPLRTLLRDQSISVALVILFASLFAFSHSRSILRPVRALSKAAQSIAAGDLDTRADVETTDELGNLARAFNSMVPKLQSGLAMRNALELAQEVQANLLPTSPPAFEGLDCAGISYAADQTGGDYFDFIDLRPWDDDRLAVAVGDVVGHGVAAALLMATARANLRSRARPLSDLEPLFDGVNRLVAEDVRAGQFMTLLFLAFDPVRKQVQWVNAGHNPPLHFRRATGGVEEIATGNPPLGIVRDWNFQASRTVAIESGDVFLLGTDGIWEAINTEGDPFGHERLKDLLLEFHDQSADELVRTVQERLERFAAGTRQADDITIVVVRIL